MTEQRPLSPLVAVPALVLLMVPALPNTLSAQATENLPSVELLDADHYRWNPTPAERLTAAWWNSRREELRRKLLVSAGLLPELQRTPLNSRVFDERKGNGFRVARVYFESLPGLLVTGNLYLPEGLQPPFPAVLTPHGHWEFGRLQNTPDGSIPARCIDFARQGYAVFSYDMIGYNDSLQLPHDNEKSRAQLKADQPLPYEPRLFRGEFDFPVSSLYGLSLAGLQLWNSIRALDFLTSLPQVDPARIGVTGASGGATQTILVMSADDRVKVAAPVNIIGMEKHPGCRCENPPSLWIDSSTLEVAALFAPRPLLLVSATQDPWTHSTPSREYPELGRYYGLFDAAARLSNHHVVAGHNYNSESRGAVYSWFREYLKPSGPAVSDPVPVSDEIAALGDLRVFPDHLLPETALPADRILRNWIESSEQTLAELWPSSPEDFSGFVAQFRDLLASVLSVRVPTVDELEYTTEVEESRDGWFYRNERIARGETGDWIELESVRKDNDAGRAVLLVYPESFGPLASKGELRSTLPLIQSLVDRGDEVFRVRGFASGRRAISDRRWAERSWPEAYNRNNALQAVQDVVTALASIKQIYPDQPVTLIGLDTAGLPAAFAAAASGLANRVIIDLHGEDPEFEESLLRLFPVGGIKRVGDFRSAALLLCAGRVSLINPGETFPSESYRERAVRVGKVQNLTIHEVLPITDANFTRILSD